MKYNYSVKSDGKWYPPNTEIPEEVKKSEEDKNSTEEVTENDSGTSGKPKSRNTDK